MEEGCSLLELEIQTPTTAPDPSTEHSASSTINWCPLSIPDKLNKNL